MNQSQGADSMASPPVHVQPIRFSGRRWQRELHGNTLVIAMALVLGFGLVFVLEPPERPLSVLFVCGVVLAFVLAFVNALFSLTRGPYQTLSLSLGELRIEERMQVHVVALDALAAIESAMTSPKLRRRPALYELRLLGPGGATLGTINANVFEADQLQSLLDHLRTQHPDVRVDLSAIKPEDIALR